MALAQWESPAKVRHWSRRRRGEVVESSPPKARHVKCTRGHTERSRSLAANEARRQVLKQAVLQYLERNPKAMDTAEGIRMWWMPVECGSDEMEDVLQELVMCGALNCRRTANGAPMYSLAAGSEQ